MCECVAVRFSLELPLTSVIWTPVGGAVGGAMIAMIVIEFGKSIWCLFEIATIAR